MNEEEPQAPPSTDSLSIAGWDVHVTRNLISRDDDSVRLEPRAMAVLVRLTESSGKVVTRQELEDSVWPGMVVGYDSLSNTVGKLRKAFGDDPKNPQIIETIPKVGYRLIAKVAYAQPADELLPAIKRPERKLAAILYADVAEYSRLTEVDEEGTHAQLSANLDRLTGLIQSHDGRVIHYAGDAVLAEFATVTGALTCAVEFQRSTGVEIPDTGAVRFRIGVNLGEVIVDRDDIYGEGVNVAARLESLADPGGICISEAVCSAVGNKLPIAFDFMGEQRVKNIERPVRAFRVLLDPGAQRKMRWLKRRRWSAAIAAVLIVVATSVIWWTQTRLRYDWLDTESTAPQTKPVIAVLPFQNLSKDPEQDYFSDGTTNDIINDLSRFSNLTVIARNSVFAYKGKPTKVQTLGSELGAAYVLEGSVQRVGDRVRINAQFVDANSGTQVWVDRFDEAATDWLDLQDQITERIVRSLSIRVTELERRRILSRASVNFSAYDLTLRGQVLLAQLTRAENFQARELFRQAIELDRGYACAYAELGWTHMNSVLYGWTGSPRVALDKSEELAHAAIALDGMCVAAHRLLAEVHQSKGEHNLALVELEKAIAINPNDSISHAKQGLAFVYSNRVDAAIRSLETALKVDPNMSPEALMHLGMAYYLKRRYSDAVPWLERGITRNPENVFIHMILAATYAQLGRADDAAHMAAIVRRLDPFFRTETYGGSKFADRETVSHIVDGLRKAGLE